MEIATWTFDGPKLKQLVNLSVILYTLIGYLRINNFKIINNSFLINTFSKYYFLIIYSLCERHSNPARTRSVSNSGLLGSRESFAMRLRKTTLPFLHSFGSGQALGGQTQSMDVIPNTTAISVNSVCYFIRLSI